MQVRFGVLNAGNFGVSQSRKRTFIWGVAPGSVLPEWPQPLHVFRSPQLTIKLPGGAEVKHMPLGRPLEVCTSVCASPFSRQDVSLHREADWHLLYIIFIWCSHWSSSKCTETSLR